jgi:nucleotide-binding universal stress UspA family protein
VAKIVVGVDASPGALRALAWAADEAHLRLASLQLEGLFDEVGETVEGIDVQRSVVVVIPSSAEDREAAAPARLERSEVLP